MGKGSSSHQKNSEIINSLLIQLECVLFMKTNGMEISDEEFEIVVKTAKQLVDFDEEYLMMQEESKILYKKIEQLEDELDNLRGQK